MITFERLTEATWCRTCIKRDKCDIKEIVATEQRLVNSCLVKCVVVKVKCRNYIKDIKLPDTPAILELL